jgi:hypothetical protein
VLTTHPSSIEVQYRYSTVLAGRIKVGGSETVERIELVKDSFVYVPTIGLVAEIFAVIFSPSRQNAGYEHPSPTSS